MLPSLNNCTSFFCIKPSENAITSPCDSSQPVVCKWRGWSPICQCSETDKYLTHFRVCLVFVISGLFPIKKKIRKKEQGKPSSTHMLHIMKIRSMWLLTFFFFLLYHLLKLLWNICLRLKEFKFSLSLIKVLGMVLTISAFIKATSWEAFAGDTYVLINNILHFLSQIMVELYFLISRFSLNSKFYCWCSTSKAKFFILYFYVVGCLLLYSYI